MTGIETLVCLAILVGIGLFASRKPRRPNHGLPHLEKVMRGEADEEQLRDLADSLAKSVIERAKTLRKPPLFVTASGDVYSDFFPAGEMPANRTPVECANTVLADCVVRYRDARNNRSVAIKDFGTYALCAGAGLAVSSFRRLEACSPDMRDLAEFLAPAPGREDWEAYKEHYRAAGELLGVSQARIDARLAQRKEVF